MNLYINKPLQKLSILLITSAITLSFPLYSHATTWLFLKNISGVGVFFENLSTSKGSMELNRDSLYLNAVEILKKSNIKVYDGSQWKNFWGGAFMKIKIISSKFKGSDRYAVYIDTSVYRPVVLFGGNMKNIGIPWCLE